MAKKQEIFTTRHCAQDGRLLGVSTCLWDDATRNVQLIKQEHMISDGEREHMREVLTNKINREFRLEPE